MLLEAGVTVLCWLPQEDSCTGSRNQHTNTWKARPAVEEVQQVSMSMCAVVELAPWYIWLEVEAVADISTTVLK